MTGGWMEMGVVPATAPVGAETALAVPDAFAAVTAIAIVKPSSALLSV